MSKQVKTIAQGDKVTMHFSMHLADGSVADSTKVNNLPGQVVIGDGTLTPGFEAHLLGLKAGDNHQFNVAAEDAFGAINDANIYILPVAQFSQELDLQPGLIVEFEQPNGSKLPGTVRKISEEGVTVDFNHPLAGQDILFKVDIIAIN